MRTRRGARAMALWGVLLAAMTAGMPASARGLPEGVRAIRDVAYGSDPAERFDVYLPAKADPTQRMPVIVMVHGGGWARGDKRSRAVVRNKGERWVARGFIFVSINYPMLPQDGPLAQAGEVARALAAVQTKAAGIGGDSSAVVLMGHSAGAHLVALLDADPALARAQGARPWLGTVALDSAAMDVPAMMRAPHHRLYDRAFGNDPSYWRAASPLQQAQADGPPMLMVCSSRRADSCPQARGLAERFSALGRRAQVLPEDLSHRQINEELGLDSDYTAQVEAFMASLDPRIARRLGNAPPR